MAVDGKSDMDPTCDECGSRFYASSSPMVSLCPECARRTYGTPPCPHVMVNDRCRICGWDGSVSDYIKAKRNKQS